MNIRMSVVPMHKYNVLDTGCEEKKGNKLLSIDMLHQLLIEHYPTLKSEHWVVDVDTIRASPILHPSLKRKLPFGVEKFTCVLFKQQTISLGSPLIVYFLLDEKGESFYAIDLLVEQDFTH
ncbi:hypothetical protein OLZ11_15765 [Bacillus xiamenensis]|uniref:Uncharacterized protein n=2 Tax=Bacillus xiamenensis TaxID=1178537 RepID=A0ABT4F3G5_9BACI|nr:hypothetical protein [Bacillus xiamenensis]MCW1837922.1 hypothetical protein [Bacillus xiamenensis]MCY9576591.1 hypothetical protein [Bacillus xiamenensis]